MTPDELETLFRGYAADLPGRVAGKSGKIFFLSYRWHAIGTYVIAFQSLATLA